ncbi:ADP-dependent NAD(P)H-hydrate dehydratase [Leucobacter sp. W1478]|uniref:ADP-dependent NAD(P)H-hydrate dehydratase n=1 Tax=Leucobacter sp. W1478 TaxID=3439065 RepID=UPI003F36964E
MSAQRSRRPRRVVDRHERPADSGIPVRWDMDRAAALLVEPSTSSDKYRRGILGLHTGSAAYPGAAVLGAQAAWRTGLGLVRFTPPLGDADGALGLPSPAAAILAVHPETVFLADPTRARVATDAWVVGSGTDPAQRSEQELERLRGILAGDAPVVVDAGALDLLVDQRISPGDTARRPGAGAAQGTPVTERFGAPLIFTPHRGEFVELWKRAGLGERPLDWPSRGRGGRDRVPAEHALVAAAVALAARLQATVLLKGSTSVTATPGGLAFLSGPATPWLATAGTGDVLAGILGALIATHAEAVREDHELLGPLGATAAVLHDAAARRASGDPLPREASTHPESGAPSAPGGPITAGDVALALPATIAELLSARRERLER